MTATTTPPAPTLSVHTLSAHSMTGWPAGTAHPHRRAILAVLCLSLLVVTIDNTVLNTALPTLARALPASTTGLQWITDSYTLVFASLLVTAGALGDRFGRRRSLTAGLVLFAAGSIGAALSGGTGELIAFRAVMGLGGAFVMPATLSLLSGVFPEKERPGAIAAWSAVAGVGIVVGPTLGGLLLDHFSWGSVFWVNVPLVAIALVLVRAVVPEMASRPDAGHGFDPIGAVLSALGLVALVDAVIEAPDRGWLSALTVGEGVAAAVILSAFVLWELRSEHPMIDVRVFRYRAFSAASASVTITFFALFGSLFALTQYLQLVHGYSPLAAGVRALPFAIGMGAFSPLSSVLAKRVGVRVVVPVGLLMMGGGLYALSGLHPTTPYLHVMWAVAVMGSGMGLVMAPASESIMTTLPPERAGVGSAVNDTVREVGGSLGVAAIGSIVSAGFRSHLDVAALPASAVDAARSSVAAADGIAVRSGNPALVHQVHQAFTTGMAAGFEVAAAVAVVGAVVVAVALPGRRVR